MRLIILLSVLLGAVGVGPALATDWRFLAAHDDQSVTLFYDRQSVRVTGDFVQIRVKRVFSEQEGRELAEDHGVPEPVAYSVERVTLDCAGKRIARRAAAWVGVSGKTLDRDAPASGLPWRPMRPGGLGRALCEELD
ncbi:MAG: surface-adhesin E family protein [Solidesulfovibrio sp. DCME]|uniref:surface-adhesin E family protein n=1 Tax=Solidesulfovibrio sp. DCME TaxID=3447380 RepID=UPI003D129FA6